MWAVDERFRLETITRKTILDISKTVVPMRQFAPEVLGIIAGYVESAEGADHKRRQKERLDLECLLCGNGLAPLGPEEVMARGEQEAMREAKARWDVVLDADGKDSGD